MTVRSILDSKKSLWSLPFDDVASDLLVPALGAATSYDCMAGFFSSGSIAELSPGLARFLGNTGNRMRLLISPILEQGDINSIRSGLTMSDMEVESWASEFLGSSHVITETALERHTRECLAYLLALDRIEIRVVLTRTGIFHRKNFILRDDIDVACLTGSANLTVGGLRNNHETMQLSCSWKDSTQADICLDLSTQFEKYWRNEIEEARTLQISSAIRIGLLKNYQTDSPPTFSEYKDLISQLEIVHNLPLISSCEFEIPSDLKWESGPYSHQGQAVSAWEGNGKRGIISLATGGGKTLTSLICAQRLFMSNEALHIVISVPTKPLAKQWDEECRRFGLDPIAPFQYKDILSQLADIQLQTRALDRGTKKVVCSIILNGSLKRKEFQKIIRRTEVPTLFIADECHNLGSEAYLASLPDSIPYRLGLSATPVRQYDIEGSIRLEDYFGSVVFELSLSDAIGVCLVPYDYYVVPCFLNEEECDEFAQLTHRIRKMTGYQEESGKLTESLKMLYTRRARIIETAESKIQEFERAIDSSQYSLERAIVFCTGKDPSQLLEVNSVLAKRNILFRQITQKETSDTGLTSSIISDFRLGRTQVLTTKQVLNEGANFPEVETAFFLGSSATKREWIQRRGRVLRMCPSTNKSHAQIIDFIALPPIEYKDDCISAVRTELSRCEEFAASSRNRYDNGSGRLLMEQLKLDYLY